jgi:hypothetical protein
MTRPALIGATQLLTLLSAVLAAARIDARFDTTSSGHKPGKGPKLHNRTESFRMKDNRTILMTLILLLAGAITGIMTLKAQSKATPAEMRAGKEWLAVMNKDNDNTVDKKEFLDYMEEQFKEADWDHDGTLDAAELGRLRLKLAGSLKR